MTRSFRYQHSIMHISILATLQCYVILFKNLQTLPNLLKLFEFNQALMHYSLRATQEDDLFMYPIRNKGHQVLKFLVRNQDWNRSPSSNKLLHLRSPKRTELYISNSIGSLYGPRKSFIFKSTYMDDSWELSLWHILLFLWRVQHQQ